ncbi:hypothetical protein CR513_09466, partial [Mucuna pruriens]
MGLERSMSSPTSPPINKERSKERLDEVKVNKELSRPDKADSKGPTLWVTSNQSRLSSRTGSIPASKDRLHQSKIQAHIISHMTRKKSFNSLHPFDPKIEKTLNRIRKSKSMHVGHSSDSFSSIPETDNFEIIPNFLDNPLYELDPMENNKRTLKELAKPDVLYKPWCIQYSQLGPAQSYELKSRLIHLLPKFHDLVGDNPHKHLKEFHMVCSMMRPQGILEDYINMKVFLFSFDGAVKDWLYLQPVMFNTWEI